MDKSRVFILDIGDGGAKSDKFERDIRLLEKGLEDNPRNVRYTFYLANSLRDAGRIDDAIAMYQKRAAMSNTWIEEIWYSYYAMGICYMRQEKHEQAVYAWMQAYQKFPERLENLYEIIRFYRNNCQYVLAQGYYVMAQQQRQKTNYSEKMYLFMQRDVYDYKLDYEMTVAGYYCNFSELDLARLSMSVLAYPALNASLHKNILSNYKFYVSVLDSTLSSSYFNAEFFECVKQATLPMFDGFSPSTPTLSNKFIMCTRHVNYKIGKMGEYFCQSKIETRNVLTILSRRRQDDETVSWSITLAASDIDYDRTKDRQYVGVEDVRLRLTDDSQRILYSGNRGFPDGRIVVEVGDLVLPVSDDDLIMMQKPRLENSKWLTVSSSRRVEKNWVWATDTVMVYAWHPLTLGTVSTLTSSSGTNLLNVSQELLSTPSWFKHVRGSTSGVVVDGGGGGGGGVQSEIWFICHVVNDEDRRFYYHLVVILEANTFKFKKHTRLFKLSEEKAAVEYALGFLYEPSTDEFLIGYSVMDCRTEFKVVSRQTLLDLCC